MCNVSLSTQISQIMHSLATLPGGQSIRLVTKNFPRVGPAEEVAHYQEDAVCFSADSLPDRLEVEADPEEVIITLEGSLTGPSDKSEILQPVWKLLRDSPMRSSWDVRARFVGAQEDGQYELTVFSNQDVGLPPWA